MRFLAALVCSLILPVSIVRGAAGSALEVLPGSECDFGSFPANRQCLRELTLVNRGNSPLRILGTRSTCGCAVAEMDRSVLAPGERSRMMVMVVANSVRGRFSKRIAIMTDEPGHPATWLELRGEAKPLLQISPGDKLYLGYLPLHQPWHRDFQLTAFSSSVVLGTPSVISATRTLEARLDKRRDGEWRLRIEMAAAEECRNFFARITIPVIEPKGWPPAAVELSGLVGYRLRALPDKVLIPAASRGRFLRRIGLTLIGEGELRPDRLNFPSVPGVSFKVVKSQGRQVELEVGVASDELRFPASGQAIICRIGYPGAGDAVIRLVPVKNLDL